VFPNVEAHHRDGRWRRAVRGGLDRAGPVGSDRRNKPDSFETVKHVLADVLPRPQAPRAGNMNLLVSRGARES
jgi:hypothetical protein